MKIAVFISGFVVGFAVGCVLWACLIIIAFKWNAFLIH